jgi:hypothetical protein
MIAHTGKTFRNISNGNLGKVRALPLFRAAGESGNISCGTDLLHNFVLTFSCPRGI